MVRFRVASDLHLDLRPDAAAVADALVANDPRADCLVLAGDVAEARWPGLRPFLERARAAYDHLVYVPGNHEYYGGAMHATEALLRAMPGYLNCGARDVGGVRVLGCTLWAAPPPRLACFNDFLRIRTPDGNWTRRDMCAAHMLHVAWLEKQLAAGPALVVTHHAPVMGDSSPDQYRGSRNEAFFASDVGAALGPRTLGWVFGHTHHAATLARDGYALWTNALGYPGERTGYRDLVIDVSI
jgi:3',5'-cyclic AMP phosphodiesterase CpdA